MARPKEIAKVEVRDSGNTTCPTLDAIDEIRNTARFYAGLAYMLRGDTIPGHGRQPAHDRVRALWRGRPYRRL